MKFVLFLSLLLQITSFTPYKKNIDPIKTRLDLKNIHDFDEINITLNKNITEEEIIYEIAPSGVISELYTINKLTKFILDNLYLIIRILRFNKE